MPDPARLGAQLGPRLAQLLRRSVVQARRDLLGVEQQARLSVLEAFGRLGFAETREPYAALVQDVLHSEETPEWMRTLFARTASRGQLWLDIFRVVSLFFAVLQFLQELGRNQSARLIQQIWRKNPNLLLPPDALARAVVEGEMSEDDARHWAASQGIAGQQFETALRLADSAPPTEQILDLLRRGVISEEDARRGLKKNSLEDQWIPRVLQLRRRLLEPAALAEGLVRGIIDEETARRIAEAQGVAPEDLERLQLLAGSPPGIQELLFAYRRGIIDEARLIRGIRQSRIRNEWIDVITSLRHVPMSAEQAIEAHVQGHLSEEESRRIAEQNGLDPRHWQPLFETAGNPPGPETVLDWYNRGILSEQETVQALRESRLKNKYIPMMLRSRVYLPPVRSIPAIYRRGGITRERALELLRRNGVEPDLAEAMLVEGSARKTEADRDLAKSEILALYRLRIAPVDAVREMLGGLGYDPEEINFLLAIEDLRRARAAQDQAVGRVHAQFVAGRISETDATTALDRLGIPVDARDELLATWEIERETNVRTLTPAEITRAFTRGLIDEEEAFERLRRIGYGDDDAGILIALAAPRGR